MHRYRIVAQISLILSILNLVLATPIVVQEIHGARADDGMVVAEGVPAQPAMVKKSDELEAASDRPTSPPPGPSSDVMTSPQHSPLSEGSTSSGYPAPHLSSDSSDSGYSWLLVRPARLSPNRPPSLHKSASPGPSVSGPSEIPPPEALAPPHPPSPGAGASGVSTPAWLHEMELEMEQEASPPPNPQFTGSNWAATTETSAEFTTSHLSYPSSLSSMDWSSHQSMSTPFASASAGSLSSHYFSASDGLPPTPPSPPPENAKFFNEKMIKNLKIVAGVTVVGGIIAAIAGTQIKHHHRDCQDS